MCREFDFLVVVDDDGDDDVDAVADGWICNMLLLLDSLDDDLCADVVCSR